MMYYNSYIKRIKSSIRSEDIDETIKELELLLQYTNKRIVHKIRFDKFCNYPTKLSIGNNILQAFSFELNKHGLDIVYDYSNDGFIDKELSVYLEDVGEYTSEDSEHYYCDGCETHNEHGSSPENSDNYYCIDCFNENTSTCEQCNYSYHH